MCEGYFREATRLHEITGIVSAGSYLVIRCGSCKTFTYVDRFQEWKLCPVCGATINVRHASHYLEVEDFRIAENIVSQLELHLQKTRKKDLSQEEREQLRAQYAEWIRGQAG